MLIPRGRATGGKPPVENGVANDMANQEVYDDKAEKNKEAKQGKI